MLESALDFIIQAASSSLFMFCFCNVIIVIILIQFKQSPYVEQESAIPLSVTTATSIYHIQRAQAVHVVIEGGASELIEAQAAADNLKSIERPSCSKDGEESPVWEESEEDDELRRRVEEFIDKVNKRWKAEGCQ